MTATATTTDIATLTDDELVAMVAVHGDDAETLALLVEELDNRDREALIDADEPTEEDRRRDLVQQSRRPGETLENVVDRMYGDVTMERYLAAEDACRGTMLNALGRRKGLDSYTLFHGPASYAVRHASPELLDWFRENGRQTWIEFKAEMLGRPSDQRAAAVARARTAEILR